MSERTTSELIETLGDDIDRCHRELIGSIDDGDVDPNGDVCANYQYHARQLIRAIFAFVEAVTFSIKVQAAVYCLNHNRAISDAERFFAADVEHVLTDRGEVVERPARIRLADNIRFAFVLQEKALGLTKTFDPSKEWRSYLKCSIKVRDRLTHPKLPEDIDVSGTEIVAALKAYEGFKEQAMAYANLSGTPNHPLQPTRWAHPFLRLHGSPMLARQLIGAGARSSVCLCLMDTTYRSIR